MFQSIKIDNWPSDNPESPNFYRFNYILVDDEFGEVSGAGAGVDVFVGLGAGAGAAAIIIEYSKRKLNVEGNLVKYLTQLCSKYNDKLTELLAWFDRTCLDPQCAEFAVLWKTVDQAKLLKYAVFM